MIAAPVASARDIGPVGLQVIAGEYSNARGMPANILAGLGQPPMFGQSPKAIRRLASPPGETALQSKAIEEIGRTGTISCSCDIRLISWIVWSDH